MLRKDQGYGMTGWVRLRNVQNPALVDTTSMMSVLGLQCCA